VVGTRPADFEDFEKISRELYNLSLVEEKWKKLPQVTPRSSGNVEVEKPSRNTKAAEVTSGTTWGWGKTMLE